MSSYNPSLSQPTSLPAINPSFSPKLSYSWNMANTPVASQVDIRTTIELDRLKEEIKKKDELISQLASVDSKPALPTYVEFKNAEDARAKAATLEIKNEALSTQVNELQMEVGQLKTKLRDTQTELNNVRESEARQSAAASLLRERVSQFEQTAGNLEDLAGRSGVAVGGLQSQLRETVERSISLEQELRQCNMSRDLVQNHVTHLGQRHTELMLSGSKILNSDISSVDVFLKKVQDLKQDRDILAQQISQLQQDLTGRDTDLRASRETIQRLVSEVSREQLASRTFKEDFERVRQEKEYLLITLSEKEKEMSSLHQNLDASQKSWEITKKAAEEKEFQLNALTSEVKETSSTVRMAATHLIALRNELGGLLSEYMVEYHRGDVSDEYIKSAVRRMKKDLEDKRVAVDQLELRLRQLGDQALQKHESQQILSHRNSQMESELAELRNHIIRLESDLASGDVLRDSLRASKGKYMELLEKLGTVLKLDKMVADVGMDIQMDALLARAEQLVRNETNEITEKQTSVYNLQRKVKALKEQLESKDLHLDLLRKKTISLEEKVKGCADIEKEKDGESARNKKLCRQIERLRQELAQTRSENRDIKAQLLETTQFKMRSSEQNYQLDELERYVGQLERVKERQAQKISGLKQEMEYHETSAGERGFAAENAVKALSSELRTTKQSIVEMQKREKQLLDLREVVARLLGLDLATLAVPDYEIISRLEKLVQIHSSNVLASNRLESALEDMESGFREGYYAHRQRQSRDRSPSPRRVKHKSSTSSSSVDKIVKQRKSKQPIKSLSPDHVDTRKY